MNRLLSQATNVRTLSTLQTALDALERRYQRLYEAIPGMIHSIDGEGRLVYVSDLWLATLGYTRQEVIGHQWVEFLTPLSRAYAQETVLPELLRCGRCEGIEYQARHKDGSLVDIVLSSIFEFDAAGAPLLSLTVIENVTTRKRVQSELAEQYERLRVTLHSIGDGVIATDAQGRVEYLNGVAERLTGWSVSAARGMPSDQVFRIVHEEHGHPCNDPVAVCLAHHRPAGVTDNAILVSRHGVRYCIEDRAAPIKDANGQTVGAVLVFRDVSEQRRLNQEMLYRATHDMLTGLYNREEFERCLHNALIRAQAATPAERYQAALMYIDLDQFKLVNDAGGHAAGDQLLKQVVGIVNRFIDGNATFARLGGDEFGMLLEHCSLDQARELAQSICDAIDIFRFQYGNQYLRVGASIGLVSVDKHWPTTMNLLRAADSACYAAKEAGRNRVHTYFADDRVIELHHADMQWVRRLERALDNGHFALYWQQIQALDDPAQGLHAEILLRMIDDGKLILPGAFLPAAERFFMAPRIDRWVLRTMFEWMARHRDQLSHVDSLSINLSGLSIGDREFHRYVYDLIESTEFDHHKLCFEVTETAAITNLNDAVIFLESMRQFGVRFSLDDFGSGVSSFGYLKNLDVDFLKIDGQFIIGLSQDLIDQATVRCIHEVARITGKKTIAEFVETEATEAMLREIGIHYTQGFLRHRPAALDELLTAGLQRPDSRQDLRFSASA
jgi:diguanylate cyclase (GGDEF)-like protein/PAS domain S-box-containing protein